MTPGAAQAAPRGAQDSSKGAQEPYRNTRDAPRSSLEVHIGCQEAPKIPPRGFQELPRGSNEAPKSSQAAPKTCTGASQEALCRARSTKRRGYKTVLCAKLMQTYSQHRLTCLCKLDMWI